MPSYLLDTDILSQLLREKAHPAVMNKFSVVPLARIFTSAITIAQLFYGAYSSVRPNYYLERIRDRILLHLPVLPFDAPAAQDFGQLRAQLEEKGRPIGHDDFMIASIARTNSPVLVTHNLRPFSVVPGLLVEDWFS